MAATRSCGLVTEISPLPQTKIGKKDEQLTEKQQFRVTAVSGWQKICCISLTNYRLFITIIYSNFQAKLFKSSSKMPGTEVFSYMSKLLATNVSLLELVAAYGKPFFHNRPSEVMKSK